MKVFIQGLSFLSITGGRYAPFQDGYRPQLFIRTADVTATLNFPEGTPDAHEKMVSFFLKSIAMNAKSSVQVVPGDNVELAVTLHTDIALEVGSRFTLREGGKTSAFLFLLFHIYHPG